MNFKEGFDKFEKELQSTGVLLSNLVDLITKNTSDFQVSDKFKIYELSYLKMYVAFEEFTECAFVAYLLGETTTLGYSPKLICKAESRDEAFNIIHGTELKKSEYIEWANLRMLAKKANVLFRGKNPFQNLIENNPNFSYFRDLRNVIAHSSTFHYDTMKSIEEVYFTTFQNRSAGELLSTQMLRKPNKEFFYFLKDEIIKSAKMMMTDPN